MTMTAVECYRWGRARVVELVDGADADAPVAACPGWRVHDVVAHLTGIAADFVSGRLPSGDLDRWTAEQVQARRDAPLPAVVAEWEGVAGPFEAAMAGPLSAGAPRFAADVVSHYFDIAATLGRHGDRRSPAVDSALETFVAMLDGRLGDQGTVAVLAGGRTFSAGQGPPRASLAAEPYEALRALSGRRTETEIAQMAWEGEVAAVLARLSPFPFPREPLGEIRT